MSKELFSFPDLAQEFLGAIESFSRVREFHLRAQLLIFRRSTTALEIDAVLNAGDRPRAASELFAAKPTTLIEVTP